MRRRFNGHWGGRACERPQQWIPAGRANSRLSPYALPCTKWGDHPTPRRVTRSNTHKEHPSTCHLRPMRLKWHMRRERDGSSRVSEPDERPQQWIPAGRANSRPPPHALPCTKWGDHPTSRRVTRSNTYEDHPSTCHLRPMRLKWHMRRERDGSSRVSEPDERPQQWIPAGRANSRPPPHALPCTKRGDHPTPRRVARRNTQEAPEHVTPETNEGQVVNEATIQRALGWASLRAPPTVGPGGVGEPASAPDGGSWRGGRACERPRRESNPHLERF